jgi:tetratricopeptide (TPR) repeat protein
VAGATSYQVSLLSAASAGPLWSTTVANATSVQYPGSPALAPGTSYRVQVQTTVNGVTLSSDQEPGLSFTLLPADAVAQVQQQLQVIQALTVPGVDDAHKRYLTAQLDDWYGLVSDAVAELASSAADVPDDAGLRLLGNLYLGLGLSDQAEAPFRQALDRATQDGDIEGQAQAEVGLGQVYAARGNATEAQARDQQALDLYARLGDDAQVKALQNQIRQLAG